MATSNRRPTGRQPATPAAARAARRLPRAVVDRVRTGKIVGVRAGLGEHRIIDVWAVVVEDRVFVRSWRVTASGWYRAFLDDPRGVLTVEGRSRPIPIRAVPTRSERLRDAIGAAYLEKYSTPGSLKYARDLGRAKSRATTLELVPR
jgi:hypothetical protein